MKSNKIFMEYTKNDLINFLLLMIISLLIIPITVKSGYWYSSILIPWLCLALASIGQQIVMGYAGQLALGAAGFMAAGAFACYNLILRVPDIPFFVALALSGLIAAAFGILFGLPSLRVRGIYLMVATLASQFFIVWMIDKFGWFKNYDSSGIITAQDIVIMGKSFTSPLEMYLVIVFVVTVLTLLAINMARGSTGRNWMAVRDMDIALSLGISLRQLERLFQRFFNLSPKNYYMKTRLQKARHLLLQTEMNVLQIAMATGFTSSSHFSKCYKLEFDITPFKERGFSNREN